MLTDLELFKSMNLLGSRSSCKESLDWILSYYDSDSIDLTTLETYFNEDENIPEDWKRDVNIYRSNIKALEYVLDYNDAARIELDKWRVTFVDTFVFEDYISAYNKKQEIIENRINIHKTKFSYCAVKDNTITKITENEIDNYDDTYSFKVINHLNQEIIAETKEEIENVKALFIEKDEAKMQKRVRFQRNITDPSGLFNVWVDVS